MPAVVQVNGFPVPVATVAAAALATVQPMVSGGLPVTPLAVKVTGWQTSGAAGLGVTLATDGAGFLPTHSWTSKRVTAARYRKVRPLGAW